MLESKYPAREFGSDATIRGRRRDKDTGGR
jgi:hypothetical protein